MYHLVFSPVLTALAVGTLVVMTVVDSLVVIKLVVVTGVVAVVGTSKHKQ